MNVAGDEAKRWNAVRLDSFAVINDPGSLLSADDQTGEVKWLDHTGEKRELTLGAHAIRLVLAGR